MVLNWRNTAALRIIESKRKTLTRNGRNILVSIFVKIFLKIDMENLLKDSERVKSSKGAKIGRNVSRTKDEE